MTDLPNQSEDLIHRFQSDLKSLRPIEVIRKHITTGNPARMDEIEYFELRRRVADEFELHPSTVVLVGSSRLGFSIAPQKRYKLARPKSDLDLALVSTDRFDDYWDRVFDYSLSDKAWQKSPAYQKFVRMLFQGWIDPRGLPSIERFDAATRWTTFFDSLMQSRVFGQRRISARLYRSWNRLELYQEKAVRQCLINIGE